MFPGHVDVTITTNIHFTYISLLIYLLLIAIIKFHYSPDNTKTFSLCKVLNLRRLTYIILCGNIVKFWMYFVIEYGPPDGTQCTGPDGRYLYLANKIVINLFVALRSRYSLSSTHNCDSSTSVSLRMRLVIKLPLCQLPMST